MATLMPTLVPTARGASFGRVTEPSAMLLACTAPAANDAVVTEPGTTDAAIPAETAYGTVIICCRGRISAGEAIATPLFETTVSPRYLFVAVNEPFKSFVAAAGIGLPPAEPRMTLNVPPG